MRMEEARRECSVLRDGEDEARKEGMLSIER